MRIYLAARYPRRAEIAEYGKELQALGHVVTSRWLWGSHETMDFQQAAREDLEDIDKSDCVISFTEPREHPWPNGGNNGGRHFELGYAAGTNVPRLIIVGHYEHVFHHLPGIEYFETWDECKQTLGASND